MKKRVIAFLMALAMCIGCTLVFAACGDTPSGSDGPAKTKLNITFPSKTFVYDGTVKYIYVEGEIPDDVTVTYTGNGQVHVGVYAVVVTFTSDNDAYELPAPMSATMTITTAGFNPGGDTSGGNDTSGGGDTSGGNDTSGGGDTSGGATGTTINPHFNSECFTYDGFAKSIYVTNIPDDVRVSYQGNGQVNAGTYTVTATFSSSNTAYSLPQPITATLTILPRAVKPVFSNPNFIYDGTPKYLEVTGLPKDVTVSYTGNDGHIAVGKYTVTVTFSSSNPNYALPQPTTVTLKIYIPTDEYGRPLDDLDAKKLNYLGASVNMLYWSDVEDPEFDVDRITGDNVQDAIFDRNCAIECRLNVSLDFDSTPGNVNNRARFVQKVQNVTDAGTRDYDLIATYSRTAGTLAIQGYLYDLNDIQNSHINLSKPWWPPQLMDNLSVGGHLYMLSGDMSNGAIHQMQCLYFNKDLFSTTYNQQAIALGFIGDSEEGVSPACQMLYEYAYHKSEAHPQGGKWTNEMLINLSSNFYKDLNGNGRDENDRYGFCSTTYHIDAFYTGANLKLVDQVDDNRYLIISPDYGSVKTAALVGRLGRWLTTSSCFVQKGDGLPFQTPFVKGNALFLTARVHVAEWSLLDVDFVYGILPTPKYDEYQVNYYTCMGNPFSIYSIYRYFGNKSDWDLDSNETLSMLTAVLECWASEGYRLTTPEIFEVNMQLKYADTQYETDMFEYVRASRVFDLGRIFTNDLSFMSELPSHVACSGASWANTYSVYKDSLDTKMRLIVESFNFD